MERFIRWSFIYVVTLVVPFFSVSASYAEENALGNEGRIDKGNIYYNPTLRMRVNLPSAGQIIGRATDLGRNTRKNASQPDCRGPLCGPAAINVAVESRPLERPAYTVLLAAYKLSPEYQNSTRHPLKKFADVMIVESLGKLWVPEGELTPILLGGREAFRLLAHNRRTPSAKAFMYVSMSNGYVFMLVATAIASQRELQSAVENMQLTN